MHPEPRTNPVATGSPFAPRLQAHLIAAAAKAFQRPKLAGRRRSDRTEQALKGTYKFCGTLEHMMREVVTAARTQEEALRVLYFAHAVECFGRELLHDVGIARGWTPRFITIRDVAAVFQRATLIQGRADTCQLAVLAGDANLDEVAEQLYCQRDQLDDEIAIVEQLRRQRAAEQHIAEPPVIRHERVMAVAHAGRGD